MKRWFLWLGVAVVALIGAPTADADVVTVLATADGRAWDKNANDVWGDGSGFSGDTLVLDQNLQATYEPTSLILRSALEFDLRGLPDRELLSATLRVRVAGWSGTPAHSVYAYAGDGAIGYGDMTETGTLAASFDFDDYSVYTAWRDAVAAVDVTAAVADLLADGADYAGFLLVASEGSVSFNSLETAFNASSVPQIILEFAEGSPPIADAGSDQTVACTSASGTEVQLDAAGSWDPDGEALSFQWSVPEGSNVTIEDPTAETTTATFPLGVTLVTLMVTDESGEESFDDVLIVVQDETPPLAACTTDRIALWPPRHDMIPVEIRLVALDGCDAPDELTVTCAVSSSESDDALGDGSFSGDVDGADGYASPVSVELAWDESEQAWVGVVDLRAERDGTAAGRTYTVSCEAADSAGNTTLSECVVIVPHAK